MVGYQLPSRASITFIKVVVTWNENVSACIHKVNMVGYLETQVGYKRVLGYQVFKQFLTIYKRGERFLNGITYCS